MFIVDRVDHSDHIVDQKQSVKGIAVIRITIKIELE